MRSRTQARKRKKNESINWYILPTRFNVFAVFRISYNFPKQFLDLSELSVMQNRSKEEVLLTHDVQLNGIF